MFREYDLRGLMNDEELNEKSVTLIGKGFGTFLLRQGIQQVVVGYDSRSYSEDVRDWLVAGLRQVGCNVTDVGLVISPVVYFAQYHLNSKGGAMITASHNPDGWSGFKLSNGFSKTLLSQDLKEIYRMIEQDDFESGEGTYTKNEKVIEAYLENITKNIKLEKPLKVIIDCGNGTAGAFGPQAFRKVGTKVGEIFCNLDTSFPFHFPNPSNQEARVALSAVVRAIKADIGICFDGDGDRLGVVDEQGNTIWSDKIVILLARHLLKQNPGATIVYDVKCTQGLEEEITANGGKPVMWKTGHSYIKQKMQQIDAELAGEHSGHIFYKENNGYDDAVFAALKLVEYLSAQKVTLSELMKTTPQYYASPNIIAPCPDEVKYDIVDQLVKEFKSEYDNVIDINGARVVFEDGWGLVRASSNLPELVLIFEAKTAERLSEIKEIFRAKTLKYPEVGAWENE